MSREKGLVMGQDLIDSFDIDVLANVVSQFVVLLFLESLIVERGICLAQLLSKGLQEEVHERSIVEDTVNVGAHAFVVDDIAVLATIGKSFAHVDLITLSILTFHLPRHFLATHRGGDGEEAEAREALDVALHMMGVANLDAHELVAATDAQYGSTIAMSLNDGLSTAVTTQFIEIVEGRFCTR